MDVYDPETEYRRRVAKWEHKTTQLLDARWGVLLLEILSTDNKSQKCFDEAIHLSTLFLKGNMEQVQKVYLDYLHGCGGANLFRVLSEKLSTAAENVVQIRRLKLHDGDAGMITEKQFLLVSVLRITAFCKWFVEGHKMEAQEMMREQPFNHKSFNLIDDMLNVLTSVVEDEESLQHDVTKVELHLCIGILEFLVEVTQGPCAPNQLHIASKRTAIDCFKRILGTRNREGTSHEYLLLKLKSLTMKLLEALLEARGDQAIEAYLVDGLEPYIFISQIEEVQVKLSLLDKQYAFTEEVLGLSNVHKKIANQTKKLGKKMQSFNLHTTETTIASALDATPKIHIGKRTNADSELDTALIIELTSILQEADNDKNGAVNGKKQNKAAHTERSRKALEENSFSLFNVMNKLSKVSSVFAKKVDPMETRVSKNYQLAYAKLTDSVKCIEIFWNGQVELLYFLLPAEASALTKERKESLLDKIPIETQEVKLHAFMDVAENQCDEMDWRFFLNRTWVYRLVSNNHDLIKNGSFIVTLFMNLIMLYSLEQYSGNEWLNDDDATNGEVLRNLASRPSNLVNGASFDDSNSTLVSVITSFRFHQLAANGDIVYLSSNLFQDINVPGLPASFINVKVLILIMAFVTGIGEIVLLTQQVIVQTILRANTLKRQAKKSGITSGNMEVFRPLPVYGAFFFGGCVILAISDRTFAWARWVLPLGLVAGCCMVVRLQRSFWDPPTKSVLSLKFCLIYDTFFHPYVFTTLLHQSFFYLGFYQFPFFALSLVLRALVISPRTATIAKAVTVPFADLMVTFCMFFATLYLFATIGFQYFNDDLTTLGGQDTCSSMLTCYFYIFSVGWRSNDIGMAMSEPDYQEASSYAWRVLYDVAFYVIVGVLLNNIVTGIILDTFASLRENASERLDQLKNECFITGIHREAFIKAGLDFERDCSTTNDRTSNYIWNYVFFMYYLEHKDKDQFNGGESFVYQMIHEKRSFKWIPSGTSWRFQNIASGEENGSDDDEDALNGVNRRIDDLAQRTATQLEQITKRLTKLDRLDELEELLMGLQRVEKQLTSQDQRAEQSRPGEGF
jgi:hypothetical protein